MQGMIKFTWNISLLLLLSLQGMMRFTWILENYQYLNKATSIYHDQQHLFNFSSRSSFAITNSQCRTRSSSSWWCWRWCRGTARRSKCKTSHFWGKENIWRNEILHVFVSSHWFPKFKAAPKYIQMHPNTSNWGIVTYPVPARTNKSCHFFL